MARIQKTIAIFLVLFLVVITLLCLVDFRGGNSSINALASFVGLKATVSAPTIAADQYGVSIVSKDSVRPNIAALLVYAILGFVIASTIYSLQPKVGGLGSSDWTDVGRRMSESAYYEEAIDAYSIAAQLNPRPRQPLLKGVWRITSLVITSGLSRITTQRSVSGLS